MNICGEHNPNWKGGRTSPKPNGVIRIMLPNHPKADSGGYVSEHVHIAEMVLERNLPDGAVVHHVDGDASNNRRDNLIICQDQGYHMLLHQRTRALRECGDPNLRKCPLCKKYDYPANMRATNGGKHFRHTQCDTEYHRRLRAIRREAAI